MTVKYDAVICSTNGVVFESTPELTVEWLKRVTPEPTWTVLIARSMNVVSVEVYLAVWRELQNSIALKKREKVRSVVQSGLEEQTRFNVLTGVNPNIIERMTNQIMEIL